MQLLELKEDEKKVRSHETMQKSRKSRTSYIVKSVIVSMLVCFVYMIYLYSKVVPVCSC